MASMILRYWMKMRGGGSAVYTPPTSTVTNGILLENGVDFLLTEAGDYVLQEA